MPKRINIGKKTIIEEYIEDNQYKKVINMTDKYIAGNNLMPMLLDERKYVVLLAIYISKNLRWGTNVIELKPANILSNLHIDRGDISRGIKRLIELNIIVQANTIEKYKDLNKYLYIVNHNHIFKGNIKNLIKDTNESKD